MIPESVWLAIIVAVPTILTSVFVPIVMARITFKQKMDERQADWARQDEMAERVKDAAEGVREINNKADEATRVRRTINTKLDNIHHLVNGNVTQLMKNELDALTREVSLRRELIKYRVASGNVVNPLSSAQIELAEARIKDLRTDLHIREQAHEIIEASSQGAIIDEDNDPDGTKAKARRSRKKKGG